MPTTILLVSILVPILAAVVVLALGRNRGLCGGLALLATAANLVLAALMFQQAFTGGGELIWSTPWAGSGMNFVLRLYNFSAFVTLAAAGFGFLVTLYAVAFMKDRPNFGQLFCYLLLTLGLANGVALSDNLIGMLFFWEGLLLTLFGMIAIGRPGAWKTATKAFIIVGVTDLCLMVGIGLVYFLHKDLSMQSLSANGGISTAGLGGLAFVLMMIGALGKGGAMPFHTWIPDAATDAPTPFMAFLPAALEKLLGIYFLARLSLNVFHMDPHSWVSMMLMIIGVVTILLAVGMALVQKNYKRLLGYHAISQVGYMVLGVGTGVPAGIVGGLFHMINNALYKSALFMTGGAVEKQAGTTELAELGGLGRKMPVTFACFTVAALAISGVPPLNGFWSKELVYDGALERGTIFYIGALLGSFLTAASFLKLGHSAFCGPLKREHEQVREAPAAMLLPMLIIAGACVWFGVQNVVPIQGIIQPIVGTHWLTDHVTGEVLNLGGWHVAPVLLYLTLICLLGALVNHLMGVRATGSGLKAVDHIHYAPGLHWMYDRAERRWFDPYDLLCRNGQGLALALFAIDRAVDWLFNVAATRAAGWLGMLVSRAHTGSAGMYVAWCLVGALAVVGVLLKFIS